MAFLPRGFYNSDPSFTPLFRLLSDFDSYSREMQAGDEQGSGSKHRGPGRLLTPKFDFHETKETYELHGELPGIEKDNLAIEFTDPQTVVIRGHVERTYSAGTPPAGLLQSGKKAGAITEGGEEHHSHKVTVEDEAAAEAKETGNKADQVVKHKDQKAKQKKAEPSDKFWVSERSFGEFSRTFSFPGRIDQDAVTAKLENGVLNLSVPKAKKSEARRIAIN